MCEAYSAAAWSINKIRVVQPKTGSYTSARESDASGTAHRTSGGVPANFATLPLPRTRPPRARYFAPPATTHVAVNIEAFPVFQRYPIKFAGIATTACAAGSRSAAVFILFHFTFYFAISASTLEALPVSLLVH